MPGPTMPMPGPDTFTVPVKSCCGLLTSDVCDCAREWAETVEAFRSPIRWHVTPEGVEATR
ncbi:MAG TPA: hypothetical protein VIQ30_01720 [Pseudonocardia sp.]